MTTNFSYDVIKSIIGHLDIKKRIHIAKFCPTLKSAEQKSQLHLEVLRLHKWFLQVDCLIFGVGITYYFTTLPKTSEELWKKYLDLCFAGRGTVKVRLISCKDSIDIISNLPKGLKMKCQEIEVETQQLENIKAIQRFLTTPFPEKLSMCFDLVDDLLLEEKLLKQAKFLVISKKYAWSEGQMEQLTKLRNENIHVESGNVEFKPENLMKIAESWLVRCPDVGTKFTVGAKKYNHVLNVIKLTTDHLGAVPGEVLETELLNCALRYCVTIQMRSGHELNIFGGKNVGEKKGKWLLGMKVMETSIEP